LIVNIVFQRLIPIKNIENVQSSVKTSSLNCIMISNVNQYETLRPIIAL